MSDSYHVVAIGVDQFIIFTNQDKDFWVVQQNDTVIYEGVYPLHHESFVILPTKTPILL